MRNRSGDERILQSIVAVAHDDNVVVRRAALVALRDFNHETTIPVFLRYITDPDFAIREAAVRGLHNIAPPAALEPFMDYVYTHVLNDDAPWFWMVAATLGDIGDPSAIPALIEFVQHHNDELRPAAVKALLTISHRSAVPQLVALLNHEEGEIRLYTVAILGRLGYPEAKPYLEKIRDTDQDAAVQNAAANALVNLSNRHAEKVDNEGLLNKLEQLLDTEGLPRLEEVRKTLRDIAEFGDPRSVEPLVALNENTVFPSIRRSAVMALGAIGLPNCAGLRSKPLLDDSSTMVRLYAQHALKMIER